MSTCEAGSAARALAGISTGSEQGTDPPSPASPVRGHQLSQGRIPSSVLHLDTHMHEFLRSLSQSNKENINSKIFSVSS